MLFHGPHIWRWIYRSASLCRSRAWVASAFVTASRAQLLFEAVGSDVSSKLLVVRWRFDDLVSGASDLRVYELAKQYNWKLFVNLDLHAKVYVFDETSIVGSANLTEKGMKGVGASSNLELARVDAAGADSEIWFQQLLDSAVEINDEKYREIEAEVLVYQEKHGLVDKVLPTFSQAVASMLAPEHKYCVYTHDLFWGRPQDLMLECKEDRERDRKHDLLVLGLDEGANRELIGDRFLSSKAFRWLLDHVEGEAYFGELTHALHSSLCDDPTPFRKTVKMLLSQLLEWADEFAEDYVIIDRPQYSQRVILKSE